MASSVAGRTAISTQQSAELSTEALAGGTVEKEVDGVVGVHEQFGGDRLLWPSFVCKRRFAHQN